MKTMLKRLFHRAPPAIPYERARDLACDRDTAVRAQLAARTDARPEILYYLAGDGEAAVRRAAAANDATPAQANVLLARDADVGVREALAEKIARILPELSTDDRVAVHIAVLQVLETLARDQVHRVRAVLAEALKDVAEAPAHVIGWLARDREIEVAGPVLQFSPLLSDDDLVAVIANAPIPGALLAIARRGTVSPRVADAIVAAEDTPAVTALLENPSAQIREETLDRLVEASRVTAEWQPPLVRRPALPPATAAKLASFVAESLLDVLRSRGDLDAATLIAVEQAVSARLAVPPEDAPSPGPPSGASRARELQACGKLDEKALMEALAEGDQACVAEGLALLAGLPPATVARIRAARSAKGVTALAWKAGLSMRFAIRLQARFAGVAPGEILNARDGFDFPMARDEMEWMLDFFRN
ncbi:MAG: DUF2336 domain-containing protein [Gemmatimonas sp.]